MTMHRTGMVGGLALAVALSGCSTLQNARERIVRPPAACLDRTVQIYFDRDSAQVTDEGRAVLRLAAGQAQGCVVRKVLVLGLADAVGDPEANLELSKRRAQSVTAALVASGLPAAEFELAAAGQAGALDRRGDARPLRRRAEVVLQLEAPAK